MAIDKTEINIALTFDRGLYRTKASWPSYDIDIDMESSVAILTLLAHQFIDMQDEQDQHGFEIELMNRFKDAMSERFENIEPIDED